jgi:orotate phosphoribosyltransferase
MIRTEICKAFTELVKEKFSDVQGIAGVATAGIAHGALLAQALELPFIYVRSEPKKHGLNNRIEGLLEPGKKYLVVEDLVSTGGSSLEAAEAVREAGGLVCGLVCIFTYGFKKAFDAFEKANVDWASLSDLDALLQKAVEITYLQPAELEVLKSWRNDPEAWSNAVMKI